MKDTPQPVCVDDPYLSAIQFNQPVSRKAREPAAYRFELQAQEAADLGARHKERKFAIDATNRS
jgi:hypothetical protein